MSIPLRVQVINNNRFLPKEKGKKGFLLSPIDSTNDVPNGTWTVLPFLVFLYVRYLDMNECYKHVLISLLPDIVSRHIEATAGSKFSFELVSQIHMACCTLSMRPNSTNLHQLKDSNQLRDFKFIRCKEMIVRGQNTKHFTYQVT